jgi:site-specific DNA-methyltransferase (adenine-specific)/adenine-specific DNA-methyltransferase
MPELTWIGKAAVVGHHAQVPFRLLEEVPDLACPAPEGDTENLIVQGDNLEALKALLPRYAGQVKCIYIDPPYNTGNEGWVYNDAVNSPEIRQWLGRAVGKEAEDLSRHDKWLCLMYPRLVLLRQFLRDDGAIFVSIDDFEFERLKLLMSEIFGQQNHVCTLIWKRRTSPDSRNLNGVSGDHEYVLCYGRTQAMRFRGASKDLTKYSNPDSDPRGPWMSDNLTGLANAIERPNLHYDLVRPTTGIRYPPHPSRGWIYGQETMAKLVAEGQVLWPKKASGRPRLKRYLSDMKSETTGFSTMLDAPGNVTATKELSEILGPKVFAFPKPSELVRGLVEQATDADSVVMDSFAGSGTTGQAVLALNRQDGGRRRFILVEIDEKIAGDITAERVRRVARGYTRAKGEAVPGLGGGFHFARLGKPLFDETGAIRADVTFPELAEFVFFKETGRPLPRASRGHRRSPLLGVHEGRGVYLLFNGILGDQTVNGGNVLTGLVLAQLPAHAGPKVVYAAACRLGRARLETEQLTFRQTPYDLHL